MGRSVCGRYAPNELRRFSTRSAVGRSIASTMRPSARNRTSSACAAAVGIVGDHHDGLTHRVDGVAQEAEDLGARSRVEVAGRFVGEQHRGPARERACDRDALLLTARQLRRAVVQPVAEPDGLHDRVEPLLVRLPAAERGRQGDVLERGEGRHEVERLEDEADLLAPQLRELLVRERVQVDAADDDATRRERVEAGEAVHQRGLARARRTHDRGPPAGRHGDVDAVERAHCVSPAP